MKALAVGPAEHGSEGARDEPGGPERPVVGRHEDLVAPRAEPVEQGQLAGRTRAVDHRGASPFPFHFGEKSGEGGAAYSPRHEDDLGVSPVGSHEPLAERAKHVERRAGPQRREEPGAAAVDAVENLHGPGAAVRERPGKTADGKRTPQQHVRTGNADHEELGWAHRVRNAGRLEFEQPIAAAEVDVAENGRGEVLNHRARHASMRPLPASLP